jgi:hypothetical protein
MNLGDLTLRERHEFAIVVTLACVRRLQILTQCSDPEDAGVQGLLDSLAKKALDRTEELDLFRRRTLSKKPSRLNRKVTEELLRRHFPSFSRPLGEGRLDREAATYLAECVEEECAGFYRSLSDGLEDSDSRTLFRTLGNQDLSFLEFVRHVIL